MGIYLDKGYDGYDRDRGNAGKKYIQNLSDQKFEYLAGLAYGALFNTIIKDDYPIFRAGIEVALGRIITEGERRLGHEITPAPRSTFLFGKENPNIIQFYPKWEEKLFGLLYEINRYSHRCEKFADWRNGDDYYEMVDYGDILYEIPSRKVQTETGCYPYYQEYTLKDVEKVAFNIKAENTYVPELCAWLQSSGYYMDPTYLVKRQEADKEKKWPAKWNHLYGKKPDNKAVDIAKALNDNSRKR